MQARQFPKYYDFLDSLGTTYKALDVRKDLEERIVKGLEAAKRVYNKWNNTTWVRPRHLLGLLCIEERRQVCAFKLLVLFGHGLEMRRTFGVVGAAAGRRGTREEVAAAGMKAIADRLAADPVLRALQLRIDAQLQNGNMLREMRLHGWLGEGGELKIPIKRELLLLATSPPQDTLESPLFSPSATPVLYSKFIKQLFVGFAHNLLVESYVSRVATVSKFHQGIDPLSLAALFMYKVRLEGEKVARRDKGLRLRKQPRRNGALIKLTKPLAKDGANKLQLKALEAQAIARAQAMQARREEFFRRKSGAALGTQVALKRAEAKARSKYVAERQVKAMSRTCKSTATGRRRKRHLSAEECTYFLPEESQVPEHRRSNCFKDKKLKARGNDRVKRKRQAMDATRKSRARKRPRNLRELARMAVLPGQPKKAKPRKRKRSGQAAAAAPRAGRAQSPRRVVIDSDDEDGEGAAQQDEGEGEGAEGAAPRESSGQEGSAHPAARKRARKQAAAAPRAGDAQASRRAMVVDSSDEEGDEDIARQGEGEGEGEGEGAAPRKGSGRKGTAKPAARKRAHEHAAAAPRPSRAAAQAARQRYAGADEEGAGDASSAWSEGEIEGEESEAAPKRLSKGRAQPAAALQMHADAMARLRRAQAAQAAERRVVADSSDEEGNSGDLPGVGGVGGEGQEGREDEGEDAGVDAGVGTGGAELLPEPPQPQPQPAQVAPTAPKAAASSSDLPGVGVGGEGQEGREGEGEDAGVDAGVGADGAELLTKPPQPQPQPAQVAPTAPEAAASSSATGAAAAPRAKPARGHGFSAAGLAKMVAASGKARKGKARAGAVPQAEAAGAPPLAAEADASTLAARSAARKLELKRELKIFEHEFVRQHGRPLEFKLDIKSSEGAIKDPEVRFYMHSLYFEYHNM